MERNRHIERKMAGILRNAFIMIFFFSLFFPCYAGSENRQKIVPLENEIYEDTDALYLLRGYAPPSHARPWSEDEIGSILSGTELGTFTPAEKLLYDNIRNSLFRRILLDKGEKASVAAEVKINLEAYVKTNDDREEWIHGYEERLPLAAIPLESWLWENFYIATEISLKEAHDVAASADNDYCNIPEQIQYLDASIPFRAFISLGGENWNIQYGRDKLSWGNGTTGNLLLSDHADYYNFIRFTTYWKIIKFTAIYAGLESYLTPEEKEIDKKKSGLTRDNYENFRERYKAFFGHRLEARITDKFTLSASEALIFGNKYPEFGNMNPVSIFHNIFAPEYSNAMLSLEADLVPFSGFGIYAQFAMDDFQLSLESGSSRPAALGYLAGIKYVFPCMGGIVSINAEGVKTDPYLYNRWHPLTRFTVRRRYWSYLDDAYAYIDKPTGYKYGPDTVIGYLGAEYRIPGNLKLGADLTLKFAGELNGSLSDPLSYNTGSDANDKNSPSGTVERETAAGLHGEKRIWKNLKAGADIYYINTDNFENISGRTENDFEFAVHFSYTF